MKKAMIVFGISIFALGTAVCVTAKGAWEKQGEDKVSAAGAYQEMEVTGTFLMEGDGSPAPGAYLSDDPVDLKGGGRETKRESYPMESEWYGPYEEEGVQEGGSEEGGRDQGLGYEGVSCIEQTEDAETLLVYDGSYKPYQEQEVGQEAMGQFWDRKAKGLPAFIVEDGYGFVEECYIPGVSEGEQPKGASSKYCLGFRWTMAPGKCFYGGNILKLGPPVAYSTLQVRITQSQKGKSYLVLKNHDTGEKVRILGSETEDGWNGTIKMGSIPEAYYSIGIENASSGEIVYHGIYGL